MNISQDERHAIIEVLWHGARFGYGNLISHLQTAWRRAMLNEGMSDSQARAIAGGDGYPALMQDDIVQRGEWDETGQRYRKAKKKAVRPRQGE